MRVVIDSSVWISALEFGGTPQVATALAARIDDIVTCTHIDYEVRKHLAGKFKWTSAEIDVELNRFWKQALWVHPTGALTGICRDPADDIIVECAILADAVLIVSGDKDLLDLQHYGRVRVLTARQYLEQADAAAT